jgi:hypothetical protein
VRSLPAVKDLTRKIQFSTDIHLKIQLPKYILKHSPKMSKAELGRNYKGNEQISFVLLHLSFLSS